MPKRDRKEIEQSLEIVIENIKYKRKNVVEINKILSEYGVTAGTFDEVIKNDMLSKVEIPLLCLITDAVYQVSGDSSIKTENFFSDNEIEESKKLVSKFEETEVKLPIIIKDVRQINFESYVTVMDFNELVNWYNNNIITYDFETQRSPKFKRSRDGVVPVPELNKKSVDEISEKMLNQTYLEDMVTINCYAEEFDPVIYNPKTRQLTIKKDVTVSILDGYHRLQAAVKSSMLDPNFKQDIIVSIRTYDTDTAKRYFGQINTNNPVQHQRLEELKQEKISYIAVKHLQIHSDLKGRIASGARVSEIAGQWVQADTLANAIEYVFEPRNNFESKKIGEYLTDFFDHLIGMFDDRFKSNDKGDLINHPRSFIGFVVIAKQFQDNDIPLDKIENVINNLKFTTENKELAEVLLNNRGISSRLQKRVREYFESIDIVNISEAGVNSV